MRRTLQYLDKPTFLQLYKANVRSQLEYASSVEFISEETHSCSRETTQKSHQTNLMHEALSLLWLRILKVPTLALVPTLDYRTTRGDMIETYRILYNLYDHNCSSMLKLHTSFYVRETKGHRLKLHHEQTRLNKRKHSFRIRVVSLWNSLPSWNFKSI